MEEELKIHQLPLTPGQRVKKLRELYGVSQANFGKYYDIPLRTIQNWETGVSVPPEYVVKMMEKIYSLQG